MNSDYCKIMNKYQPVNKKTLFMARSIIEFCNRLNLRLQYLTSASGL